LKWLSIFIVFTSLPPTQLSLSSGFHPLTPPKEFSLNSPVAFLSPNLLDGLVLILPLLSASLYIFDNSFSCSYNTFYISTLFFLQWHFVLVLILFLWPLKSIYFSGSSTAIHPTTKCWCQSLFTLYLFPKEFQMSILICCLKWLPSFPL
jgi:hypothetical protein